MNRDALRDWQARIDALSLRERAFLLLTTGLILGYLLYLLLIQPTWQALHQGQAELESLQTRLTALEIRSRDLASGRATPEQERLDRIAALQAQLVGRGDFQLTQATDVSGDCRVRVTGRVLFSGGELRAQRTVEGLLSVGGGVGAIAVGNNGTILHWDGSAWTSVASGTSGNFTGIACPDESNCMAVAENDHYALWDGTAWNNNTNGNANYSDVDCRSDINDCHATGILFVFGSISFWNGSWSLGHIRFFDPYHAIACTTNTCHAATRSGRFSRLAGGWTDEASAGTQINGIACPTDNDCWAVGDEINNGPNRGYAIFGRNAGGWFNESIDVNPRRGLYAVDCITINDCWAVGERRNGNTFTLARRSGGSWTLANRGLGSAEDLHGIDCNDGGRCWAVGNNGTALHYDGSSWSVVGTPTTETLNDVHYMNGSGGGGVSLARWWEIIN
ncbi:MAG TPA: type II secretion system protein GspM [Thiohalobacter sp.]|nr:type II secretion system protein GspM [Thiohalobacter sp.]